MPKRIRSMTISENGGVTGLAGRANDRVGWLWLGLPLAIVLVCCYCRRLYLNFDVAWLLYAAAQMWDGAKLYVDILETNPPLAVYINLPAVWAARWLGRPELPVFQAYVLLLLGLSMWLCRALIDRVFRTSGRVTRYGIWLALVIITCLQALPIFGQREHLVLCLTVPYILAAGARGQGEHLGRGMALVCGCLAGLGISFKPYFLVVWIMVEGGLAWRGKGAGAWKRPENAAIAGVMAVYAGAALIFAPEYLELAARLKRVYFGYNCSYPALLLASKAYLGIWLLSGLFLFTKRQRPVPAAMRLLFIASTAFFLTVLIQKKGWENHLYPATATGLWFLSIALFTEAEEMARAGKLTSITSRRVIGSTIFIFIALFTIIAEYYRFSEHALMSRLLPIVQEEAYGEPLYIFSTHVTPAFPLVNYSKAQWPCRFHSLWPLPGIFRAREEGRAGEAQFEAVERWLLETVATDLQRTPPKLLLVDSHIFGMQEEFDFLDYFSREPRLRELLADYVFLTRIGDFTIYRRGSGH
jgi:hypothetical protein